MIMITDDTMVYSFIATCCIVGLATTGKWQMFVNQAFAIFLLWFLAGFWRLANF